MADPETWNNLPSTDETDWLKLDFLKQFYKSMRERNLLSASYVWPTPEESPNPVFVRPIIDLPAEPEAGVTYWIDSDSGKTNAGQLATYNPETKVWTYFWAPLNQSYFFENTALFLLYDGYSGTKLIPYSPVKITAKYAYATSSGALWTWYSVPTIKTYQDAIYSYFKNFLPPEYVPGADIFKLPTFSPGDFFARVTGKETMRETAVADAICGYDDIGYSEWCASMIHKSAPFRVFFNEVYGYAEQKGKIGTYNKTTPAGLLELNNYGQFDIADFTFETLPDESIVYVREGASYKVSGSTVTQINFKTYCGFTRKFPLELTDLTSASGGHIGQSYLQTGQRAVFRGGSSSFGNDYLVGPVRSKEDLNFDVMDNYIARDGRNVYALIADDAIGEFADHKGKIYRTYQTPEYTYYDPYEGEQFTLRVCSTNKSRECVIRHDGKWVKSGTYFEFDGTKWVVSLDQKTPETTIEIPGGVQAGDYITLSMFNELYNALRLMNRELMLAGKIFGLEEYYDSYVRSETYAEALSSYALVTSGITNGVVKAETSVSYSFQMFYSLSKWAFTVQYLRLNIGFVDSARGNLLPAGYFEMYGCVLPVGTFHEQGSGYSLGFTELGGSDVIDGDLLDEIQLNTPASTPPTRVPTSNYELFGFNMIYIGILEYTDLNYV